LVEAVISVLIVGTMLVAALNAVGAGRKAQASAGQASRGLALAESLTAEILQWPYEDADAPGALDVEAGEAKTTRMDFDDVDDYAKWSASPPTNRDGSPIPWADGYKRRVVVNWVRVDDPDAVAGAETGLKRIKVVVEYNGRVIVRLIAFRTSLWQDPAAVQGEGG
jgi:hypothetical protein